MPNMPEVADAIALLKNAVSKLLEDDRIADAQGVLNAMQLLASNLPSNVFAFANVIAANDLSPKEQEFARAGKKIEAIKEHRGRTGYGLKESKETVEAWMDRNGVAYPARPTAY